MSNATGKLRHVVLFKFKDETTDAQIEELVEAFRALPNKIGEISDFEWGTDVSVEGRQKGFTHGFLVTFDDETGRDAYLPHPDHRAFGQIVRPIVEDVLVFDFNSRE